MREFLPRPRPVTDELERVCRRIYPNLDLQPFYRRFLEYVLFSPWYDEDDPDGNRKVITRRSFRQMAEGIAGHVSMHEALGRFEQDMGIDLNIRWGSPVEGRATTIEPDVHPDVIAALVRDMALPSAVKTVYLATGKLVTRRSRKRDKIEARRQAADLSHQVESALTVGTEKARLVTLLNGPAAEYNARHLPQASHDVKAFVSSIPVCEKRGLKYRDYTLVHLDAIENDPWLVYTPCSRTSRVHAYHRNLNGLPRLVRKLTCASVARDHPECCIELDLAAAQLAIAARLWGLSCLTEQLKTGMNGGIWETLLTHLGLSDHHKPLLKKTIYSICYGMEERNLRDQFVHGCRKGGEWVQGVDSPDLWDLLIEHPVITELLSARRKESMAIRRDGGRVDAFETWVDTRDQHGRPAVRSIMASVAQSWEQYLMYGMLDVLERNPRIRVLSWLHDGVTLYFSEPPKMAWQVAAIQRAVEARAEEMGICTRLEPDILDMSSLRDRIAKSVSGPLAGLPSTQAA